MGKGPSAEIFELDAEVQEVISAGIEAIQAGTAAALAGSFDISAHRRLLDVGGGTGSWSIAVLRRHPHLRATVLELPVTAAIARKRIAGSELAPRMDALEGDDRSASGGRTGRPSAL
ncbi:MAG: methyltransferase [Actinomycetota bacterium]